MVGGSAGASGIIKGGKNSHWDILGGRGKRGTVGRKEKGVRKTGTVSKSPGSGSVRGLGYPMISNRGGLEKCRGARGWDGNMGDETECWRGSGC